MPQVYTKQATKSTRQNEKNSEKESLDNEFGPVIKRAPRNKEHPYLQVIKTLIRDKTISNDCFRMLMLLLANKDDFEIHVSYLQRQMKEYGVGQKKTYKLLREAQEFGYIKREDSFTGNLRKKCTYYVSEEPEFNKCFRNGNSDNGEDYHIGNNKHVLKDTSKKINIPKEDKPPPPLLKPKKVSKELSDQERSGLYDKIGKAETDRLEKNALAHLKKCTGSKYQKMDLSRIIMEFYTKDTAEKAKKGVKKMGTPTQKEVVEAENAAAYNRIDQRTLANEKNIEAFIRDNPDLAPHMDLKKTFSRVLVRNLINKQRFDDIDYTKPDYKIKLEMWAEDFREIKT